MLVSLYLDIPFSLQHRCSKQNIRLADVKIMGANWPDSKIYCDKHGRQV